MTKDVYDTLTEKERLMFDELSEFAKKLNAKVDVLIKIIQEAAGD